ncbi:MAG: methyltransferase [Herbinix sp.]|nr:methyltransferase [Herbinix sp.]
MYNIRIWDNDILIEADDTLFSPKSIDKGTSIMLKNIELKSSDKVLDLGCGTGVVGLAISKVIGADKVTMADINPKAITCSINNAKLNGLDSINIRESNGFGNIMEKDFTLILSNPPYHTDFSVAKHFIEEGKKYLALNGKVVVVVKRLEWYKNKMENVFGGVRIIQEDDYYVLISEKRDNYSKSLKNEKPINKKHMKRVEKSQKKHRY